MLCRLKTKSSEGHHPGVPKLDGGLDARSSNDAGPLFELVFALLWSHNALLFGRALRVGISDPCTNADTCRHGSCKVAGRVHAWLGLRHDIRRAARAATARSRIWPRVSTITSHLISAWTWAFLTISSALHHSIKQKNPRAVSGYGLGRVGLDLKWNYLGQKLNYALTIHAGAPAGDKKKGLSVGHATWNWSNHFEQEKWTGQPI